MTFEEFKEAFLQWSIEKIEAKKPDGFPVCPYARKARMDNKVQYIDASDDVSELRNFDSENYEIGIAWLGHDDPNIKAAINTCDFLSKLNPHLLYFTSTTESGYFEKNISNCIFIQLKDDIMEKRDQLLETKYYDSWPAEYFHEITGLTKD
jgi:hypothetical protein